MTVLRALEGRFTTVSVQGKQGMHSSAYRALANTSATATALTGKEILLGTKSAQTKWWHEDFAMAWIQNQRIFRKAEAPCHLLEAEPHLQSKSRRRAPCCPGLFPGEKTSGTWGSSCPTERGVSAHSHSHRWPQTWQRLNVKGDLQNKVNIACYSAAYECQVQNLHVICIAHGHGNRVVKTWGKE